MKKITENQRKMIMAMCTKQGIDDELRADIAFQFSTGRTTHVSQLSSAEAADLITRLKQNQSQTDTTADVWRKRLMAAIGEYLRVYNYTENAQTIKATACRAAGVDDFNKIPTDRLRGLYNAFKNYTRDHRTVAKVDEELTANMALMN